VERSVEKLTEHLFDRARQAIEDDHAEHALMLVEARRGALAFYDQLFQPILNAEREAEEEE
jgi:hypothetical protein